ncbi:MAG: ABC transporter permease [Lachnospiraceae bacterium]|nr:ABC transporter permease [Lachnospiraceae bacterium]
MKRINPIFKNNMYVKVRSMKLAMLILIYDAVLLFIALFGFEIGLNQNLNDNIDYSTALKVYTLLTCVEVLMVIAIMPSLTAVSISNEREKKTLDILLSTGIKPRKIIIGKFYEAELTIMLYIISALPVLSIVFTIGGIQVADLVKFLIEIITTTVFIGSIGILFSSLCKTTIRAMVSTFVTIFIILFLTVGIAVAAVYIFGFFEDRLAQGIDISKISYILIINPVIDILVMVFKQYGNINIIAEFIEKLGITTDMIKYWSLLSVIARLFLSLVFLWLSCRIIDPMKNRKPQKDIIDPED